MGKGPLRVSIEDFLETFRWYRMVQPLLKDLDETKEAEFIRHWQSFIDLMLDSLEGPEALIAPLKKAVRGEHQTGLETLSAIGSAAGTGAASSLLAPVFRVMNYAIDFQLRTARYDPGTAVRLAYRFPERAEEIYYDLKQTGWRETAIADYAELFKPRLSDGDLLETWRRGLIDQQGMEIELRRRGWPGADVQTLEALAEYLPPIQDIIRFAVRGVFSEDEVRLFGYDQLFEQFPQDLAAKWGMTSEQMLWYWRSHWQLPSLSLGYEMFQRTFDLSGNEHFSEEDLFTLLKANDIPPRFWDPLLAVSYLPIRITDIRNLFDEGLLDRQGVVDQYRKHGNSPEDSELLADLVVSQSGGSQKDLTRSSIQDAYYRRVFTYDEAYQALIDIGYKPEIASIWLALVDDKIAQELVDLRVDNVEQQYLDSFIDLASAQGVLAGFDLPAEQINILIERWQVKKQGRLQQPPKTELRDYYERNIINIDAFRLQLSYLNWTDDRIEWYIQLTDLELQEKLADAAQKEADKRLKLEQTEAKNSYDVQRSQLDGQIAELKAQIADIKVMRHYVEDEDTLFNISVMIEQIKLEIAQLNVDKTNLRTDYLTQQGR